MPESVFELRPQAPFRLDLTAWTLRRRPENEIDLWDGCCYRRVFRVAQMPVLVAVGQSGPVVAPRLRVTAHSPRPLNDQRKALAAQLKKTLGLNLELDGFYRLARGEQRLGQLVRRFAGFRPPRFPTLFEALVNAIACQQLSLTVGITLLNRLAGVYQPDSSSDDQLPRPFPSPEQITQATPQQLRALGFSRQKAAALIALARQFVHDAAEFAGFEELDDSAAFAQLRQLRGIGRWSAEYVMLRGLGRLAVFPADDVSGQKNLRRWLALRHTPSYERASQLLARWRPYQGLLYFHFLLANLETRGYLHPT